MIISSPRRTVKRIPALVVAFLLSGLLVIFLMANMNPAKSVAANRLTLGLVNEDLPDEFNGHSYTFGASFVDRISKDSRYNWLVLSRSVAEKAYKEGSVDALIYIPQSFTHELLTFQETSPTTTSVEYKLEPQANQRANQVLESRIIEIVHAFNQSVSLMYYSSLADNFAEADGHMSGTLNNQKALIAALTADVQQPFSDTLPQIQNFISQATGLKDLNDAAVRAHNSFTQSATDSLTANTRNLGEQLPKIDEYSKRQENITSINAANGNKGIATQAASDLDFYTNQFEALKTRILCALNGNNNSNLSSSCEQRDDDASPSLGNSITSLKDVISSYTTRKNKAVESVYSDLDTTINNLKAIEKLLSDSDKSEQPTESSEQTEPDPTDPDPAEPSTPKYSTDPELIKQLDQEIRSLEGTRDSIKILFPAPVFGTALADLDSWYTSLNTTIAASALTPNAVTHLDIRDWNTNQSEKTGLYVDYSKELYIGIDGLVTQAARTGTQIAATAAMVPDNTLQFDAMLQNASSTSASAGHVFNGLGYLGQLGAKNIVENTQYYSNFSKILANTRTPGINTGAIYSFLASPINAKNVGPDQATASSDTNQSSLFSVNGVLIFGGGLLIGLLLKTFSTTLRTRKKPEDATKTVVPQFQKALSSARFSRR